MANSKLVSLNHLKDILPLLKDYIFKSEFEDSIKFSAEMGLVEPVVAEDGSIYIDKNGVIYSL